MKISEIIHRVQTAVVEIWTFALTSAAPGRLTTAKSSAKALMLAVQEFVQKDVWNRDVPALTYSTLMSLIPLVAFLFAIAQGFGCEVMIEDGIQSALTAQQEVANYLVDFVHNYLANVKSRYIVATGIGMMLFTLHSLMERIENAFDRIWHVSGRSFVRKVTDYTTIFVLFALLILLASTMSMVSVLVAERFDLWVHIGAIDAMIVRLVAAVPLFLFLMMMYYLLPNTYVKLQCIIVPTLLAVVGLFVLQWGFMKAQIWLTSYNVIYGSLAALPLFLLWMQFSWAIIMFCAVLCHTIQDLRHYDYGVQYDDVKREERLKVCAIVMHHVCRQFHEGLPACNKRELQEKSHLPQQFVNAAVDKLIEAGLLVEIMDKGFAVRDVLTRLHPAEDLGRLTYGALVERLDNAGSAPAGIDLDTDRSEEWKKLKELRDRYIADAKSIKLLNI